MAEKTGQDGMKPELAKVLGLEHESTELLLESMAGVQRPEQPPSAQLKELLRGAIYQQLTPALLYNMRASLRYLLGPGWGLTRSGSDPNALQIIPPDNAPPVLLELVEQLTASALAKDEAKQEAPILTWHCTECGSAVGDPPKHWLHGPRSAQVYCQGNPRCGPHLGHRPSGGPQMTVAYLLDDRNLLGSLAAVLADEPAEIVGHRWKEKAKAAAAGDPEAQQSLLLAYPWATPRDQLAEENRKLRQALRHVMYVLCEGRLFQRKDFGATEDGSSYIPALREARDLLKQLGEHDSSVADQADAWLPPKDEP